jgi:hypothetical protein
VAKEVTLSRQVPLDDSWDVVIVGGGPAGCTAAIAAAREGARTLLVEATGCLGGMGTAGLVPAWCPFSDQVRIVYGGLAEKIFTRTKAGMPHVDPKAVDWVPIDPELLKRIYDDLVVEAGVTVLFNTVLSAVETDGRGSVMALVVSNKSGLSALGAKVYVDTTGDGDLAAWAGAEFEKGDERGELQPATHCFSLGNVDEYHYRHGPNLHPENRQGPIWSILASGRYPLIPDFHLCSGLIGPRTVGFNAGHLWQVDNTDPKNVSQALMAGRRLAAAFREALAEFHPKAFSGSFVNQTAALMGTRETRRIVGDYRLTIDDYVARRSFPDEIGRNSYFVDVHITAADARKGTGSLAHFETTTLRYQPGESHGIPYRCLTPRDLRNVLVAGRNISCDRRTHGSIRTMPGCLVMGEAAGLAAALATKIPGGDVHAVDTAGLRRRLKEHGAYLP